MLILSTAQLVENELLAVEATENKNSAASLLSPQTHQVKWVINKNSTKAILVHLGNGLSKKQLATLQSGFTTFSRLSIFAKGADLTNSENIIAASSCAVKYDLWEEVYEISVLDQNTDTHKSQSFNFYLAEYLSTSIVNRHFLGLLQENGGGLIATLQVEQISSAQALKIKSWLVKQQSTVIKGLFTHMLGDLTLSGTSKFELSVPPFK